MIGVSPGYAEDKNGVAPNTVSLPSGPGSIEGLGEAFQPMLNTGTARYSINIAMPPGVAGNTPKLALQYDSGLGHGPSGLGWTFGPGAISRQIDKGIPRYIDAENSLDDDFDNLLDEYDEIDTFVGPDGEELVRLPDNTYRARIEGNFARYQFSENSWKVNLKNGTTLTFGKTSTARITDSDGSRIFRWLLEKSEDVNGNVIEYLYSSFPDSDNQKYLTEIRYGPGSSPWTVFYYAAFSYEDRPDWRKDYRSGFLIKTGKRLAEIYIGIQGSQPNQCATGNWNNDNIDNDALIRRYEISYDDSTCPLSLLTQIKLFGADNINYLPSTSFTYSNYYPAESLDAKDKIITSMNTPLMLVDNDLAELIDLNRDGLPDLLRTDYYGNSHIAYRNLGVSQQLNRQVVTWDEPRTITSQDGLATLLHLSENVVSLADMNGDGIADLVHTSPANEVFYYANKGDIGWGKRNIMATGDTVPPAPFAFDFVKTVDLDFNKRMDVVKSSSTGYTLWLNYEDSQYSRQIQTEGARYQERAMLFTDSGFDFADMNGDRLTDAVRVMPTQVVYCASQGYGKFADAVEIPLPDAVLTDGDGGQLARAKLTDINGDGLADLVIERAAVNEIWFWLNLGTDTFSSRFTIINAPTQYSPNTVVRWADMNGNGTSDLIYADSTAADSLQILDLGELISGSSHPNLLTKINNGLGTTTEIIYQSSTDHYLQAESTGTPWSSTVPFPVQVVSEVITSAGLDLDTTPGIDEYVRDFSYRDGFYEDREKQFRGFAQVRVTEQGDATAPTKVTIHEFFTGGPDSEDNDGDSLIDEVSDKNHREEDALKGLVKSVQVEAEDSTIFHRNENNWLVRNLISGADGTEIRFAYNTRTEKIIHEGTESPEILRIDFIYDSFGNITEEKNYGALSLAGDEIFTSTQYINNTSGNSWLLGLPWHVTITNASLQKAAESIYLYDGAPYTGLSSGTADKGRLSLLRQWAAASNYIDSQRNAYDSYGNIIGIMDADDNTRNITWDSDLHTFPVRENIPVGGGNPDLVISVSYNLGLGTVISSRDFNDNETTFGYDFFGRLTSIVKSGDSPAYPTTVYTYSHADPAAGLLYYYDQNGSLTLSSSSAKASSVATKIREVSGENNTFDTIQYVDGMGRKLATFTEGEHGFVVNDAVIFNSMGSPRFSFLPYESAGSDYARPLPVPSVTEFKYDVMGRVVAIINPPDDDGIITSTGTSFSPLAKTVIDELDNTRTINSDGLDRLISVQEENDGEVYLTSYAYDTLGSLVRITDARNNIKTFSYDGLKRKISMDDPDKGHMTYVYDYTGNLLSTVDNKNQHTLYSYDGVNRLLAVDFLDGAGLTPDISYHYDTPSGEYPYAENLKGQLAWIKDLSGGTFFSYDKQANPVWMVNRINDEGQVSDYLTINDYDAMGRVTATIFPDGDRVTYTYNNRSLLETIPGFIENIDYFVNGQRSELALANSVNTSYTYDPRQRLNHLTSILTGNGTILQDFSYSFDGAGNILGIADNRGLPADSPGNNTQTFGYDNLYRLTSAQGSGYGSITFQYDKIGNMTFKSSPAAPDQNHIDDPLINLGVIANGGSAGTSGRGPRLPGSDPGPHAVTATTSGLAYNYDDNGNMISRGSGDIYEWNFSDQLIRAVTADSAATFIYDAGGKRRIKKTETAGLAKTDYFINPGFEIRDGTPVKYIFDDTRRIARVEGRLAANGEAAQQIILLKTGWNFFSFEVEPDNPAVMAVFADINGKYSDVWEFDTSLQQYVNLTEFHAGIGYLVKMTEPGAITVSGTRSMGNINLATGWNLVPIPIEFKQPVTAALAGIEGSYEAVWAYDTNTATWQDYLPDEIGFLNNLTLLKPGHAYWLKMTQAAQLPYQPRAKQIYYYHPDHLGSANLVTDAAGNVVEETRFYPFGRPRHEERNGFDSAYKFTGKELDRTTGLMYYEARYYDPVISRFVSVDPLYAEVDSVDNEKLVSFLSVPQSINLYSYVHNRPVIATDPSGNDQPSFVTRKDHGYSKTYTFKSATDATFSLPLIGSTVSRAENARDITMTIIGASTGSALKAVDVGVNIATTTIPQGIDYLVSGNTPTVESCGWDALGIAAGATNVPLAGEAVSFLRIGLNEASKHSTAVQKREESAKNDLNNLFWNVTSSKHSWKGSRGFQSIDKWGGTSGTTTTRNVDFLLKFKETGEILRFKGAITKSSTLGITGAQALGEESDKALQNILNNKEFEILN